MKTVAAGEGGEEEERRKEETTTEHQERKPMVCVCISYLEVIHMKQTNMGRLHMTIQKRERKRQTDMKAKPNANKILHIT